MPLLFHTVFKAYIGNAGMGVSGLVARVCYSDTNKLNSEATS